MMLFFWTVINQTKFFPTVIMIMSDQGQINFTLSIQLIYNTLKKVSKYTKYFKNKLVFKRIPT